MAKISYAISTMITEDGFQRDLSSMVRLIGIGYSGMTIGIMRDSPKILENHNSSRLNHLGWHQIKPFNKGGK